MTDHEKSREELISELQLLRKAQENHPPTNPQVNLMIDNEEALLESEKRFREVLENSFAAAYRRDLILDRYDYLSPSFFRLTGFPVDQLKTMPINDYLNRIHRDDIDRVMEFVKESTQTDKHRHTIDYRFLHQNGNYRWFDDSSTIVKDETGKPRYRYGSIQDITEFRKNEAALRLSEERNHLLTSVTMEGILIHRNGIAKDLNRALVNMLGYEYEELLNKDFFEFVHPDDRTLAGQNILKEQVLPYEIRVIRKNGALLNVEVESKNFRFKEENWRVSAIRDITARKQTEERMRTMADMLDLAPCSITVHDTSGRFLYANQRTFEIHGHTESEFLAINLHELDVPASEAMLAERFRLIEASEHASFEVAHYHADGHEIPMEVFARKVNWRGQPAILSIATDITERKQANEKIVEARKQAEASEWRFRNYIQNSPTSVFLADQQGRYTFVNNSACNLLGYSEPELLQMSIRDLVMNRETNQEVESFKELQLKGVIRNVEKKMIRKDGRFIDVILDGKKLAENEYIAFVKDISERKQAEKALRESEEKYRVLFNTFPLGITISDSNSNIVESNARAAELLGITKAEHEARRIDGEQWRIIRPDETTMPSEEYAATQALKEGRIVENVEMGIVKPNDEVTWLNVTAAPLQLDNYGVAITYNDITARIQMERDLLATKEKAIESEERYRALYNNAPLSYQSLDEQGYFIDINPMWLKTLGYDRDEVIGKWFGDFLHPDDLEHFRKNFPAFKLRGHVSDVRFRLRRKDDTIIHVSFEGSIGSTPDGNFKQTYCVFKDITEQEKAEKALHESEERFRTANNASLDSLLLLRSVRDESGAICDFVFLDVNSCAEAMLRFNRDQLIGKRLCETLPINREAGFFEKYRQVVETGIPLQEEFFLPKTHVPACWYFHQVVKVEDGIFICHRDISERKHAEEEMIKARETAEVSKQRFKSLIENAPDGVVIIDEQGKFTYGSPNAARHFGYTYDDIIGHSGNEYTHPDDLPAVFEVLDSIIKNPLLKPKLKYRFRHKKGDFRWIETTFSNLLSDKAIQGIVLNFSDVTERELMFHELIIAKEKAVESDRLKSAFLANMSHEIRTPMNGILGFAGLLKEPGLSGEEQQEYIRIIEKSGARMLNIINEIVDISKIEAGLMEIEVVETNINETMDFAFQFFKPEIELKGLSFLFQRGNNTPDIIIRTDKEKLIAVLFNLIKNAIKYTKKGFVEMGYSLKTAETTMESPTKEILEFFIKDSGIGIPSDRQEAIFERFIQADVLDKNAMQGAGLGLSISKAYVEMLGGQIRVESVEDAGSVFYFTLPFNGMEPQKENANNSGLKKVPTGIPEIKKLALKILIVEDDEPSELLISEAVKKISSTIIRTETGIQAVNCCRAHPDIDLVLMDIRMPEMDGYTAIRHIREFNKSLIIIAQTAYGLTGDREKALEAGANDYISKPVKKKELLSIIQRYFT